MTTDRRRREDVDLADLDAPLWLLRYVGYLDQRARWARRLAAIACIFAAAAIVVAGATGALAIHNAGEVADLERKDTELSRAAAARQCARGNITRAEIHVAYRPRRRAAPAPLDVRDPILAALLEQAERERKRGLRRVRRNQPILDCAPNLVGREAIPLTEAEQAHFVRLYIDGRLDPTPEAEDVISGPDVKIEPASTLPGG